MKNLENITICIVDCKNYDNAAKSIIYCSKFCNINFYKSIYFSDIKHDKLDNHNIWFLKEPHIYLYGENPIMEVSSTKVKELIISLVSHQVQILKTQRLAESLEESLRPS
mgnify:CR=1 FL=1